MDRPDYTYHTHTDRSDGGANLTEMLRGAAAAGIHEYGVSDHMVLNDLPRHVSWTMDFAELPDYVSEIRQAAASSELRVRLGLEMDYFPRFWQEPRVSQILEGGQFDYFIGSVHFIDDFALDSSPDDWLSLSTGDVDEIYRRYWQAVTEMAMLPVFTIIGHLDLPKKFNIYPSVRFEREIEIALTAIKTAGAAVEINTAGWDKPCGEAYPSLELLEQCVDFGIPLVISDDAHCPQDIGRYFDRGVALAVQAGTENLWRLPP